ncbi:phosphotransferase family protein [Streptomyces sp. 796.1]|uniref:phosphotransferase family protein n=1 Tax=Streptomyces sp. 796.1 TaxID=3163029 RepID=UPI0039C8EA9F
MSRHLRSGERIVGAETLHGGITADVRRVTVSTPRGDTRHLVLRSFVDAHRVQYAADWLGRESGALALLTETGVSAPELVAVDPTATHCEYPSLLMTHLAGRTVLRDEGLEARVPLLARQLVAIHAVRPAELPRTYTTLTTADTVVVPEGADPAVWATAIDVIREPAPPYEGRFLHRDFQPGNVLFDVSDDPSAPPTHPAPPSLPTPPAPSAGVRISGVIDWAGASWGPADLDVAHCSTTLALLHGPAWGLRFTAAYEEAGGVLAAATGERRYWQVRDALAASEEVQPVARAWREAGRAELTDRVVAERLDAYVAALLDALG